MYSSLLTSIPLAPVCGKRSYAVGLSLLKELEAEGVIVVNDDGEWRLKEAPVVTIDPEFKKLFHR